MSVFRKVLIANRGEVAVRIIRTLREMGIVSTAIYSDADRDALFVQEADEAYHVGPSPAPQSYLNVPAIMDIARQAGADAIHPGYGFLSENAQFAETVGDAGITFIGPRPEAIRLMGDKVQARRVAQRLGVPVVPGTPGPVTNVEDALDFAREAGYPVAVKAAGGGGGRGIRVVRGPHEMADALQRATREAETYFKNPEVYLERYFPNPKHIEMQVLGDRTGRLVHLGERDCSVQRRHQKLIEESPSPSVDRDMRARVGELAVRFAAAAGYDSAGTVEFLLTEEREFYLLEMNTRIQVEHPVTEQVAGVDLIREMILAAAGEPITVRDSLLDPNGHALEVRVNAEDPLAGFRPTPTTIARYREPGGIGIRMDSGVYAGYTIPQDYDSLMAKLVAWAPDRELVRHRTLRALDEYVIDGPSSTIPFAQALISLPAFAAGQVSTTFVEEHLGDLEDLMRGRVGRSRSQGEAAVSPVRGDERRFEIEVNRKRFHVTLAELQQRRRERKVARSSRAAAGADSHELRSPMHGTVISLKKEAGAQVQAGETIVIIEAMKMENEVAAHRSGTLAKVLASVGETVEAEQPLAVIE